MSEIYDSALVNALAYVTEQHIGDGTPFFDRMDALVSSDYFYQVQLDRFKEIDDGMDWIVVSGKWGNGFRCWVSEPYKQRLLWVRGGLRHDDLPPIPEQRHHWRNFIFLDNSCYKGRTRDKIAGRLAEINSTLKTSLVIYDGSVEPLDGMKGIYRYHDR